MNNGEIVFEDCRVPRDHLLVENDALAKAAVYFRPVALQDRQGDVPAHRGRLRRARKISAPAGLPPAGLAVRGRRQARTMSPV
ncbi:MAG: hypothetical protein HY323_12215 [Betaproteobacteria bacterium]|nr:hypothetical protein [Betaproteobacteria bacterium]